MFVSHVSFHQVLTFLCTFNFLFVLGKLFWSLEITCKKDSTTIEKSDNEIVEAKVILIRLLPLSLVRNGTQWICWCRHAVLQIDRISILLSWLTFISSFPLGFPHSYPSDLHCVWTLKAPPGYRVVGQFTEFDLTESEDCSSDYVQISGKYWKNMSSQQIGWGTFFKTNQVLKILLTFQ